MASHQLLSGIRTLLSGYPFFQHKDGRRAISIDAGLDHELLSQIEFEGPTGQFLTLYLEQLSAYGSLKDGRNTLQALLESVKDKVGTTDKEVIDKFIRQISARELEEVNQPRRQSNNTVNTPDTPKPTLAVVKDWKELIAFVAFTLTSVFAGLLGSEHAALQKASWLLALIFVAIGAFVVHRKQKRKSEQERRERFWAERETLRKPQSAFRSLAPFEERDELPGRDRKIEARSIATRIANDDFRFGVLCGDTGCGKSSLLRSEVTRSLRALGFEVAYVRSPRQVETKSSDALPAPARLEHELKALERTVGPTSRILILDQFEEWFIEYQDVELRKQIGALITSLAAGSQPVRVVCAIRREFLIDFHDLSDELLQPLTTANLFHIRNFTVEQATDVIIQCAAADALILDASFAETVATDLAEGGQVRPPELQIVCTYLAASGGLETSKYRQSGGTAGILARYIQDALDASKHRTLAAKVLRALCDFPAHAKRKPRSLDELTADVNSEGPPTGVGLRKTVANIVQHFVLGRLLAEDQRKDEPTFALMHDYLVDAVHLATSDASTKTEEANQLLRYYLAERGRVIALSKLHFIRTFAEPRYLNEPAARRLIRKSIAKPVLGVAATGVAALILAGSLYLFSTAQVQWTPTQVGRHWNDGEGGSVSSHRLLMGRVLTGGRDGRKHIRVWEAKSARILSTVENPMELVPLFRITANFIVLRGVPAFNQDEQLGRLVNLSTLAELSLPHDASDFLLSKSEKWLAWTEPETKSERTNTTVTIAVASLAEQSSIHKIPGVPRPDSVSRRLDPFYRLAESGERLVALAKEDARNVAYLYDLSSGQRLAILATKETDETLIFEVDNASQLACTLDNSGDTLAIRLWSLRDGKFIAERRFLPQELEAVGSDINTITLDFLRDDTYLILTFWPGSEARPTLVLRTSDLQVATNVPSSILDLAARNLIAWDEANGTNVWDVSRREARVITGLKIERENQLSVSHDGTRAVLSKGWNQEAELWDFVKDRLIRKLPHTGFLESVGFTVDDTAVMLREEGSLISLFDAEDGEPLMHLISTGSGGNFYYDRGCRRLQVWNDSGQVLRYTEGRWYFWTFVPSRSCAQ